MVASGRKFSPNLGMGSVSGPSDDKSDAAHEEALAGLVERAGAGDMQAFEALVREFQRQATAVAYRLLNNRDDAMEVVQDAFLKAFDRLDSLNEPARFGAWFVRIVRNLSLNRRRRRAIRKTASLDAAPMNDDGRGEGWTLPDTHRPTPLQEAAGSDLRELLRAAIDELPEMQRQSLVLFSIEKLPQKQVAEILGCSVEAVKWHVFTARKKLKERLGDLF